MKEKYLTYYKKYSAFAQLQFLWDAFFEKNNLRKLSLLNRQKDYTELADKKELLTLHYTLNKQLLEAVRRYDSYDYGEGYFYQSFRKVSIRGFRDTEARMQSMQLAGLLSGKQVLEIGCNTGFMALSLAEHCSSLTAFDINPYLVEIAKQVAGYFGVTNIIFDTCSFEDFVSAKCFDAVLSFANHSTYDGNTRQSLYYYFDRCAELLLPGGLFLFESHPPEHEREQLDIIPEMMSQRFDITEQKVLNYGSFLDRNRTFIIAKKK